MTAPRIFISSTCYDLSYIRENLERFIKYLGYEPVLSEKGNVFYNPKKDTLESCITDVPSCQMFVLIIGGRFGTEYKDSGKSITNAEYNKAFEEKVPIFIMVKKSVFQEYKFWMNNKNIKDVKYISVDSTKIFEFINEVTSASYNNAICPFEKFEEIQNYLLQQWSSMMFNFLTTEGQANKVNETLSTLKQMNEKMEIIIRQILQDTSKDMVEDVDIKINLLEYISNELEKNWLLDDLREKLKLKFTIDSIIENNSLKQFLEKNNVAIDFSHSDLVVFEREGNIYSVLLGTYSKLANVYDRIYKYIKKSRR